MIYFAFGSNMNHNQMRHRCKDSKYISSGVLERFRFVYDGNSTRWKGAVGNIVPSKGDSVFGALFEVTEEDLDALDEYEGYPTRYQKIEVPVVSKDRGELRAFAYFREGEKEGAPSDEYLSTVLQGARDCGLPDQYVQKYLIKK